MNESIIIKLCNLQQLKTSSFSRTAAHIFVSPATDRAAWRQQSEYQRSLYQAKFVEFWSATVEDCRNNPRALWRTVNSILNALILYRRRRFINHLLTYLKCVIYNSYKIV